MRARTCLPRARLAARRRQFRGVAEAMMARIRTAARCGALVAAAALGGLGACYSPGDAREPSAAASAAPAGEQLYYNHCASCHGASAEGDGPVASVMQVTVPNLRNLAARNGGRFPAEAV